MGGIVTTVLIAALFPPLPLSPLPQEEERLHITEAPEELLRQWKEAEEKKDWKKLVELHTLAIRSFANHLCRPDPDALRWIRLPRMLSDRLSAMPAPVREKHEEVARQLFDTLRESGARRAVIDRYAFTDAARREMESMANRAFDEGRVREAVRGWLRVLDRKPSATLVARLATAFAALGDRPGLDALKARVRKRGWTGTITIAGRPRELARYLDSMRIAPPPASDETGEVRATNEVPLGAYSLKSDRGRYGTSFATSIPAYGRLQSKEVIVFTNGIRVTTINPARAAGGELTQAVEWQYPSAGTVRNWMPSGNGPLPQVGADLGDGRAFVTMFSNNRRFRRRRDGFDGPASIRAFDLATGDLLWDTDSVEVRVNGLTEPMIDTLPFGRKNFCFAGPPILRGTRLFAAVMTSPLAGRECYVLCLNPSDGTPRWCTMIASAPRTRRISIPSLAVDAGQVLVLTNFGAAAALDGATGTVEWLIKHEGQGGNRPSVNPPLAYGSRVALLPQNRDEPIVLDRWTGRRVPWPALSEDIPWTVVHHLIGRAGDWIVVSGEESFAIRTTDGKVVALLDADTSKSGRGVVHGGRVYLPLRPYLQIYDTRSWKLVRSHRWTESDENPGNLLIAAEWCMFLSDRLDLSTSRTALEERFGPQVKPDPPRPLQCRQFAQIMESSGRLTEAIRYYGRALSVWEKDPAWEETADTLREKIDDLKERLGNPAPDPK